MAYPVATFTPASGNSTGAFLAATTAPTAVQPANSGDWNTVYRVVNSGGSVVFLGVGATAALALSAAAIVTAGNVGASPAVNPGVTEVFSFPPGSFITGITVSGTSLVYVTAGLGA